MPEPLAGAASLHHVMWSCFGRDEVCQQIPNTRQKARGRKLISRLLRNPTAIFYSFFKEPSSPD